MARIKPKKFIDKVVKSEVKTAFWVSWLAFVFVVGVTFIFFKYKGDFLRNIFVEAHGMLFDLFVIATFILWLNKKAEKKRNIQRWQEEINDFRYWKSREAMYRIVGNIKRLEKNGFTKIDLRHCFLKYAPLRGIRLKGAILRQSKLQNANLWQANLKGANLRRAELNNTNLREANLQNAILIEAELEGAILDEANLQGVDLHGTYGISQDQLAKVKTLYNARLENYLMNIMKEYYPKLFEKPDESKN